MAAHWDPAGAMGVAAKMCQESPDLKMVGYKTFSCAAKGMMDAETVGKQYILYFYQGAWQGALRSSQTTV